MWQVWRRCTGRSGGSETGPVRRIVLRSTASLAIRQPVAPYAGFSRRLALELAGLPDGTTAVVERKRAAGDAARAGDPRGETVTSAPLVVVVRRGTRWSTSAQDAGAYTGTAYGVRRR